MPHRSATWSWLIGLFEVVGVWDTGQLLLESLTPTQPPHPSFTYTCMVKHQNNLESCPHRVNTLGPRSDELWGEKWL
jgi:hypothetical protein